MKKIFGLGLSKTGTKTLKTCLETLGYSCANWSPELLEDVVIRQDLAEVHKVVAKIDSFRNWPWPLIYKELDRCYPSSRFILTVRKDTETWLRSVKKHVEMHGSAEFVTQKRAYGYESPNGHEREYRNFYENHTREVKDHFNERRKQLLVVCWETGDGWEELCSFLNKPVPNQPFPMVNKTPAGLGFMLAQLKMRLRHSIFK